MGKGDKISSYPQGLRTPRQFSWINSMYITQYLNLVTNKRTKIDASDTCTHPHARTRVCTCRQRRTHQQRELHSCPGAKHALPQSRAANQGHDPNKDSAYETLNPWLAEWFQWEHVSAAALYVPVYPVLLTGNQTVTRRWVPGHELFLQLGCHFDQMPPTLFCAKGETSHTPRWAVQTCPRWTSGLPTLNVLTSNQWSMQHLQHCQCCGTTVAPLAVLRITLAEESYVWTKKRSETYETGRTAGYRTKIPPHLLHHSCFLRILRSTLCRKQTGHLPGWCSSLSPLQTPGFSQNALSSHEK